MTRELLRVLIIDDSADDALLVLESISRDELAVTSRRVDQADDLADALRSGEWDVVISDYSMPHLAAEDALRIVKEADPDLPFIVVSGIIGEDAAVEMMRAGALDYVMKDRLTRLLPAILRETREAKRKKSHAQSEAALNELRERLQATVERAPVGITNVGPAGEFLHVNPRFCEMVGYSREELLSLRFHDITHPLDVTDDAGMLLQMIQRERAEYRVEKRYVRKNGEILHVSLNTAPVFDAEGRFQYFASILLDVSEKKQLELALRERDERYRQIVDTAQEGIWTIDPESRTTFVNRRMAEMLGYTEAEMKDRHLYDFIHMPDFSRVDEYIERRRLGLSDEDDFIMRRKNGETIRIHFTANALRAVDGSHIGALAMVTDITARWTAEQTVRRQKRELEEAQRIAHLGSWRRDIPGTVLEWSDEVYRIFGVDRTTITPSMKFLIDATIPEDRAKLATMIALSHERSVPMDVDYRIRRPDGAIRTVHTFGEITRDEDGIPREVRGVTQDITERVAAAAVHDQLNRHVQLLLHSTTQGIFGMDREGRCTFINRAASENLGYEPGELVGASIHDIVHRTLDGAMCHENCRIDSAAREANATSLHSDTLCRRDGTLFPIEYSAAPVLDNGAVAGAVLVFTDVSERRRLQARLDQSDRVSSLGHLAATMAHEFNNVLMGIQPFAELLARQNPAPSAQRATHNILQAVQRGRSITRDILRFARPAELLEETIDINEWLPSMEAALIAVLGDRIHFRMHIDGGRLFVRGDRHQLEQVLTNLAANARHAMHDIGELTIDVQRGSNGCVPPEIAQTVDQYLHLSVCDTGCGMDDKTLKDIFDPFFTTKRSGTGLGLAVVHQVMQLHGGSIVAESVVGKGSVFHLFLPLSQEPLSDVAEADALGARSVIESILMVEHDEAIASGVAGLLREEGIAVEVASSGGAALASLATHLPDVLILTVGLPDIDGRLLYEQIAEDHADLAVIFASGSNDEALLQPYLRNGHVASLAKPYEFGALLNVLGTLKIAEDAHP